MSATKPIFSLEDLHHGWWQATLSNGTDEVVIKASSITEEPLLLLLWAVRSLLSGANTSKCIWLVEPGQYRWLFTRMEKLIHINIIWFDDTRNWSDDKGETVFRTEYDLLTFAKRLAHQLDQLAYRERSPAVAPQDYQKLQEAIATREQGDK